ncbi:hypothetical protein D3C75_1163930 [compost metagenome]
MLGQRFYGEQKLFLSISEHLNRQLQSSLLLFDSAGLRCGAFFLRRTGFCCGAFLLRRAGFRCGAFLLRR